MTDGTPYGRGMSESARSDSPIRCDDEWCNETSFHGFVLTVKAEKMGDRIKATPVIDMVCAVGHPNTKHGIPEWIDPVAKPGRPPNDLTTAMCLSGGDGPLEYEGSATYFEVAPDQGVMLFEDPKAAYTRTPMVLTTSDRGRVAVFMYAGPEIY